MRVLVVRGDKGAVTHVAKSVLYLLVVRMDIYESTTLQWGRSVFQILVVGVDIGVVVSEARRPQSLRTVVQLWVVTVDKGVMTYEAKTPQCGWSLVQSHVRYRLVDLLACHPSRSSDRSSAVHVLVVIVEMHVGVSTCEAVSHTTLEVLWLITWEQ